MTSSPAAFSRLELQALRRSLASGTPLRCPGCRDPLLPRPIPPRDDVAYVRRRIWLLCPRCGRSALLEAPGGERPVAGGPSAPSTPQPLPPSMPSSPARSTPPLPRLGWREWVALPSLGIGEIKAKVDTGARSSSLHAMEVEEFVREGGSWVRFSVAPQQGTLEGIMRVEAPLADRRSVRSSSGEARVRPVVELEVQIGGIHFPCEVTLARRDRMGFRMLLGRTALRNRFLVDPAGSFLQPRPGGASPRGGSPGDPLPPTGHTE